jgi:hypothetical protein
MMNISTKRLEALVSLRPFQNFNDLVSWLLLQIDFCKYNNRVKSVLS